VPLLGERWEAEALISRLMLLKLAAWERGDHDFYLWVDRAEQDLRRALEGAG